MDLNYNVYTNSSTPKIFDRYLYSSSSDDDESQPSVSYESSSKRLDYMIQFLDRKLSTSTTPTPTPDNNISLYDKTRPLPEFIAKRGRTGIFKPPVRAAVHPNRPPSLEVRPHPLRESQFNRFLRTIVSTEKQLWGGGESGVRVWELRDLYKEGKEEDAAPFKESVAGISETVCMVGDEGSGVMWSGHRDGRIRCWKMDGLGFEGFREVFSWQAHRGPVLSLVTTCYGECVYVINVNFFME